MWKLPTTWLVSIKESIARKHAGKRDGTDKKKDRVKAYTGHGDNLVTARRKRRRATKQLMRIRRSRKQNARTGDA